MADIAENLRTFILTSSTLTAFVADRVHHGHVPANKEETYIYFSRSNRAYEHTLDSEAGEAPRAEYFDMECCSRNPNASNNLADAVRGLFPMRGTFGDATIKGAFVNDQDEDYIPLNNAADEGVTVQALQMEICP